MPWAWGTFPAHRCKCKGDCSLRQGSWAKEPSPRGEGALVAAAVARALLERGVVKREACPVGSHSVRTQCTSLPRDLFRCFFRDPPRHCPRCHRALHPGLPSWGSSSPAGDLPRGFPARWGRFPTEATRTPPSSRAHCRLLARAQRRARRDAAVSQGLHCELASRSLLLCGPQ